MRQTRPTLLDGLIILDMASAMRRGPGRIEVPGPPLLMARFDRLAYGGAEVIFWSLQSPACIILQGHIVVTGRVSMAVSTLVGPGPRFQNLLVLEGVVTSQMIQVLLYLACHRV